MPMLFDAYMRARQIDTDLFLARVKKRGGAEASASARRLRRGDGPGERQKPGALRRGSGTEENPSVMGEGPEALSVEAVAVHCAASMTLRERG